MNSEISILLASYNGERYIEQQLLSLIGQTYKEWQLYVRDDGSKDETVTIVRRYEKMDNRIHLVTDEQGSLGCIGNFLALLPYSKTAYTIFCDQDDFWLENKLEVVWKTMKRRRQDVPQLVYCNAYSYNMEDGVGQPEIAYAIQSLPDMLFRCGGVQGCSSLFNDKLKKLVLQYHGVTIMHDFTVTFLAVLFGEITFIDKPLMLYRQHECNVTGIRPKSLLQIALNFWKDNKRKGILNCKTFETMKQITACFCDQISNENLKLLDDFFEFPNLSRLQMLNFVLKNHCTLYRKTYPILLKILTRKLWDNHTTFL